MTFVEAFVEAEEDEIREALIGLGMTDDQVAECLLVHHDDCDLLSSVWSAVGADLRPLDWFLLHGLPLGRYAVYLMRCHVHAAVNLALFRAAEDPDADPGPEFDREIGRLVRCLAGLRRAYPSDPGP